MTSSIECFTHYFAGAEKRPQAFAKALDEWLSNPIEMPQLTEEQLAALEQHED